MVFVVIQQNICLIGNFYHKENKFEKDGFSCNQIKNYLLNSTHALYSQTREKIYNKQ